MRKSKWILQTLILSGALNGALLGTFFYFLIRDNPLQLSYVPKEDPAKIEPSPFSATFLARLSSFPFVQLVELLKDERRVEQGYTVRDCALGALSTFYDFDIERALGKKNYTKRKWQCGTLHFNVFPGMTDADFEKILMFAASEKFPFTAKGLYKQIRRSGIEKSDPELIAYFCHTPQFLLLETLFARTGLPIRKKTILSLALECGWEQIETFLSEEKKGADFSSVVRQNFLLKAIEKKSKTAAYLMLMSDKSFAIKHLDDKEIKMILSLITEKTEEALYFVHQLANSPRSDEIRELAYAKIVEFKSKLPDDLAGHFYEKPGLKNLRPTFREAPPAAPGPATHVIQPGETLWQIARKYNIPIERLMQQNRLSSTVIQPGKTLKL